jgi:chemotaxis protein CheC
MPDLSELQCDALMEMVNVGVGNAAADIATFVDAQVQLSCPSLAQLTRGEAARNLSRSNGELVCGVLRRFGGNARAQAAVVFPEREGRKVLEAIGRQQGRLSIADLEHIGTTIMERCFAAMGEMLGLSFSAGASRVLFGTSEEVIGGSETPHSAVVLVRIGISIADLNVEAYVALFLDAESVTVLQERLESMLEMLN